MKRKESEGKPMENERKTYPNRKTKKNPKKSEPFVGGSPPTS